MQVYKVSIFSKVIYLLLGGMFSVCAVTPSFNAGHGTGSVVLSALLVIGVWVFVLNKIKSKIIITDEEFVKHSVFEDVKIPLTDIKGYRLVNKGFKLYYGRSWERDIYVYDVDYSGDLTAWLRKNITDLDQQDREIEYDEMIVERKAIITNTSFITDAPGSAEGDASQTMINQPESVAIKTGPAFINDDPSSVTENDISKTISDELDRQLEKFFWVMLVYDMIAVIGMLYIMVKRDLIVLSFLMIYPLIGLVIIAKSKGLIRLCYKTTSPRHSLFIGMLVCALILALARPENVPIYYFDHFSLLVIAIAIGFISIAWLVDVADRTEILVARRLWLLVIGCLYGFGFIMQMRYIWGYFIK